MGGHHLVDVLFMSFSQWLVDENRGALFYSNGAAHWWCRWYTIVTGPKLFLPAKDIFSGSEESSDIIPSPSSEKHPSLWSQGCGNSRSKKPMGFVKNGRCLVWTGDGIIPNYDDILVSSSIHNPTVLDILRMIVKFDFSADLDLLEIEKGLFGLYDMRVWRWLTMNCLPGFWCQQFQGEERSQQLLPLHCQNLDEFDRDGLRLGTLRLSISASDRLCEFIWSMKRIGEGLDWEVVLWNPLQNISSRSQSELNSGSLCSFWSILRIAIQMLQV